MKTIAGVILAGGKSSRMGRDKALTPFAGRPMIAHVMDRLAPQVRQTAINANGDAARFAIFSVPVIADEAESQGPTESQGPLGGIVAGLRWAQRSGAQYAAFAPCDAPFVPCSLVAHLLAGLDGAPLAIAQSERGLEPLFSLWSVAVLEAVAKQPAGGSVYRTALALGAAIVLIPYLPGEPDWALNLNDPGELAAAQAGIRGHRA